MEHPTCVTMSSKIEDDDDKFTMGYNVEMSDDDCVATLTIRCDTVISIGMFLDALDQVSEVYQKMAEDGMVDH